ncbi:CSE2-domain-containing protein [Patellaria atrata CBS 101060]|uniref:Mediator of RNA polymerase II transcription subunit 21 n=1 Tax=Patellaria atrata CBS 101060 TaxID=1346257 RepID=A0A9P4VL67_9PEZI|nr:CSE2-domain-containing protein [Patellaria atrata CBS 101060]
MADRLTQLQECFDQLATQMYASLMYIQTHAPYGSIPGQPDMNPNSTEAETQATTQPTQSTENTEANRPTSPARDPPDVFQEALHELSRDLILKEQQIEHIISVLPGIGTSEKEQMARIQELNEQIEVAETERQRVIVEKQELLSKLDRIIMGVKRA